MSTLCSEVQASAVVGDVTGFAVRVLGLGVLVESDVARSSNPFASRVAAVFRTWPRLYVTTLLTAACECCMHTSAAMIGGLGTAGSVRKLTFTQYRKTLAGMP